MTNIKKPDEELQYLGQMLTASTTEDARRVKSITDRALQLVGLKPKCPICHDTGINHGVQCKPSKAHPTGWKSEICQCVSAL